MTIEYVNQISDIEAYGRLIYDKSPTVRQHKKKAFNTAVILVAIFGLVLYFLNESTAVMVLWLVLSVAWLSYIPFQHKKRYLKNMVKTFEGEQHRNFFGQHRLTIDESGITDEIENGINTTPWDRIEHAETTGSHIFIFVDSSMAYAIPKNAFEEGLSDNFIKILKSRIKKQGGL